MKKFSETKRSEALRARCETGFLGRSNEQLPVETGLSFQRKGIGAGRGGHAPKAERCPVRAWQDDIAGYFDKTSNGRHRAAKALGDDAGGLFSGGDEGLAGGDAPEQGRDVGGRNHFQESVRSVVAKAPYFAGCIVEGKTGIGAKLPDQDFVKALFGRDAEVVLVPEVDDAHDAPEVVDPVGVIERHAPAMRLGRETPEEQDACVLRQERLKRMLFDAHMLQR